MRNTPSVVGLALALVFLWAIFFALERWFASVRQPSIWRRERGADFAWWFLTPFFSRISVLFAVVPIAAAAAVMNRPTGAPWFRSQSLPMQALEVLVASDLIGYLMHRSFHRRPLWRFHAVHHSSETLDWLAASRVHPVNELLTRVVQLLPLYLAGFDPRVVAFAVPFLTFHAIAIHANVSWDFGPLRYLLSSPRFHRWHHTSEAEGLDRNFAGLFPWIDLLFGTFYMPTGRQPENFGVRESVPRTFVGQLLYPFRRA